MSEVPDFYKSLQADGVYRDPIMDEVTIQHFWIDGAGKEWCFFRLNGQPWLANEDDADDRKRIIDGD